MVSGHGILSSFQAPQAFVVHLFKSSVEIGRDSLFLASDSWSIATRDAVFWRQSLLQDCELSVVVELVAAGQGSCVLGMVDTQSIVAEAAMCSDAIIDTRDNTDLCLGLQDLFGDP